MTLTDHELAEIEARMTAIRFIEAPWRARGYTIYDPHGMTVCERVRDPEHADFIAHARADVLTLIAVLRASRKQEKRYETAGRTWLQALGLMRSITVHDPRQTEVVRLFGEAEKQMRAALGEEIA